MKEESWFVYMIECRDNSYYTGITNNISKRINAHRSGKGSKYVLSKGFSRLISSKEYPNKSESLKAEYKIKQLPRDKKLSFFNS